MKMIKRLFALVAVLLLGVSLVACGGDKEEFIVIGNTATTSGPFAVVGVPFNQAIQVRIEAYNKLPEEERYLGGKKIKLVTYDDKFEADTGKTLTEKLVEEDKIFALVGHFGTPTVGATIEYINETGVPMVYAATGINALYQFKAVGSPVMPVQPIYQTDGRIMAARAIYEELHGELTGEGIEAKGAKLAATDKVGVLYTNDDAGLGILEGIEEEFKLAGREAVLVKQSFEAEPSSLQAASTRMKTEDVKAIIIASNQAPFSSMTEQLANDGNTAAVFTSYVNSDPTAFKTTVEYDFNVYVNAWVDVLSEQGQAASGQYVADITASEDLGLTEDEKTKLMVNAFGTAGYIAIDIFIQGLAEYDKTWKDGDKLDRKAFIAAMEKTPFNVPMGSTVDFTEGKRWGIANMSLLRFDAETKSFVLARPFEELVDIEKK